MTQGGDAAEQIVRLSLEGMEVAVKVSGESAKEHRAHPYGSAERRAQDKGKGETFLHDKVRQGAESIFCAEQRS